MSSNVSRRETTNAIVASPSPPDKRAYTTRRPAGEGKLGHRSRLKLFAPAAEDRAIFTRDRNTMTAHARDRMLLGLRMAGLMVLAEDISIGKAIQNLGTLAQAGNPGDLEGQILFLS